MNVDEVLKALRREAEDVRDGWGMVYLDNASARLDLTPRQFAGYLSVLEQRGLYRTVDNYAWGEVRMENLSNVPQDIPDPDEGIDREHDDGTTDPNPETWYREAL